MWINVRGEQEHREGTGFVKSLQNNWGIAELILNLKIQCLRSMEVFFVTQNKLNKRQIKNSFMECIVSY